MAREAIATARRLGDRHTLLEVLHDAISALMDMVDPAEQRAVNLEAESLALELGDRERLLRTHGRLVLAHLALGELALADARIEAFEALSKELAAPWVGFRAHLFRAIRAQMHGRFDEAERHAQAALAVGTAAGEPLVRALYASNREARLRASERHDELLAWESEVRASRDKFRFQSMWQATAAAQIHARREDEAQTRLYLGLVTKDWPNNLFAMSMLVEPVILAGSRELVERVYERIAAARDEYVMLGMSYLSRGRARGRGCSGSCSAGSSAGTRPRRHSKTRSSAAASSTRARIGHAPNTNSAACSPQRGRPEDHERARALFMAARAHALELELPSLLELIDMRLARPCDERPRAPPPSKLESTRPPATPLPFTLVLEGDVFSVSFEGRTFRLKDSLGLRYLARSSRSRIARSTCSR